MAMAIHNGNSRRARDFLAQDGIKLSHQTLREWATKRHVERYAAIRADYLPQMRAQAADEHMDLAERAMQNNALILDRLSANVGELPVKELPGAARNMAVTAGVHTEKAQLLNDQPTQRVAIDLKGTLKELKSMGVEFVEGTVESEEDVVAIGEKAEIGSGNG